MTSARAWSAVDITIALRSAGSASNQRLLNTVMLKM